MNYTIIDLAAIFPFHVLRRLAHVNPIIINYHVVSDKRLPHVINLYKYRNIKSFIEDLDFFNRNFRPIGLKELLLSISSGRKLPANSLMLTIDDGFREIYEIVAPLLIEKKIPATIFITKNYLDNVELGYDNKKSLIIEGLRAHDEEAYQREISDKLNLNEIAGKDLFARILKIPYQKKHLVDEIGTLMKIDFSAYLENQKPYLTSLQVTKLLSDGFTIGGHSIDHPRFSELSLDDQINQAVSSVDFVSGKFSLDYKVFAFPYSDIGVSGNFFESGLKHFDATFSTQGLREDKIRTNLQRVSVEKFDQKAEAILKFHYMRNIIHKIQKTNSIKRETL